MRHRVIAAALVAVACSAPPTSAPPSREPSTEPRCRTGRAFDLGPASADAAVCFAFGPAGGFASWNDGAGHRVRPLAVDGTPTGPAHPWAMPAPQLEHVVALDDGRFVLVTNAWDVAHTHPTPMLATLDAKANVVGRWARLPDLDGHEVLAVAGAGNAMIAIARRFGSAPDARFVDVRLGYPPKVTTSPVDLGPGERTLPPVRVDGAGPLAFVEVDPEDGVVDLVSDGRVTRGRIEPGAPILGVAATWDGPRIRLAMRRPEGRSTSALFEADGRIHDVREGEALSVDRRPRSGCGNVWTGDRVVRGSVEGSAARVVTLDCGR